MSLRVGSCWTVLGIEFTPVLLFHTVCTVKEAFRYSRRWWNNSNTSACVRVCKEFTTEVCMRLGQTGLDMYCALYLVSQSRLLSVMCNKSEWHRSTGATRHKLTDNSWVAVPCAHVRCLCGSAVNMLHERKCQTYGRRQQGQSDTYAFSVVEVSCKLTDVVQLKITPRT